MVEKVTDFSVLSYYFNNDESLSIFSEEEKKYLEEEKEERTYQKGEIILEEGNTPNGVYLFTQGTAKLYKIGFTGKEQIIRFLKKGDLIGYRSILSGQAFGASVTVLEETKVEFYPEKYFVKMLEKNAAFSFQMLQLISKQLGDAADTITTLAQKTVRERLAEVLMTLEKQLGVDNEGYIKIALTREEMANLIGTATESAIRLISEFKNDGLIAVQGRRIKIENRTMVSKLGHFEG